LVVVVNHLLGDWSNASISGNPRLISDDVEATGERLLTSPAKWLWEKELGWLLIGPTGTREF